MKMLMKRWTILFLSTTLSAPVLSPVQAHSSAPEKSAEELQFVILLTRHGVRSPTSEPSQYAQYSAAPWPEWNVKPGYLTAHGFELMRIFGTYHRERFIEQGLLSSSSCDSAAHVTILADSDERTRETGRALAEGLFPGCAVPTIAKSEGTNDPLFHPREMFAGEAAAKIGTAAIAGRIGGDANSLTEAYRPQLATLDRILSGCGHGSAMQTKRTSIFDIPASLSAGPGNHRGEARGPLSSASSLAENLLLEYTEGMGGANLGWGCLDEASLREVMQLHEAAADFNQRTPAIAGRYAANLLNAISGALEQSATGKPVPGAPGKPGVRVLILVGHDTNIATVAGALGLTWIVDGRRDDTPPGGALVFELWHNLISGEYSVRTAYTAQTLRQMREREPLSKANPPALAPVFVPDCGREDSACKLEAFTAALRHSIAH